MKSLSHVRIVMVNTTHPGNIGAAARAMKNMGLEDLALVQPQRFPSGEALARASGADDVLARARICARLEDAIADRELVIGASARLRSIAWPQLDPRACAALVTAAAGRAAILFGREHSGLTNEELERCHYLLHIPCNPGFGSLNVAAALQIVAYELFLAAGATASPGALDGPAATSAQLESCFDHLETTLRHIRFLHASKHTTSIMRRLRRLFLRARLESAEIHLLRGILGAMQRAGLARAAQNSVSNGSETAAGGPIVTSPPASSQTGSSSASSPGNSSAGW